MASAFLVCIMWSVATSVPVVEDRVTPAWSHATISSLPEELKQHLWNCEPRETFHPLAYLSDILAMQKARTPHRTLDFYIRTVSSEPQKTVRIILAQQKKSQRSPQIQSVTGTYACHAMNFYPLHDVTCVEREPWRAPNFQYGSCQKGNGNSSWNGCLKSSNLQKCRFLY